MMFSNFVTFTEVVKLSRNIYEQQKRVNFSDTILKLIFDAHDIDTFEEIYLLIDNFDSFAELSDRFVEEDKDSEITRRYITCMVDFTFKKPEIDMKEFYLLMFFFSCKEGHLDNIKYFITEVSDKYNRNIGLSFCCMNGRVEEMRWLLENGCSVYFENNTPLHLAIEKNHMKVVDFIFKTYQGFDINYLLLYSTRYGNLEAIKYFVDAGADIHYNNNNILGVSIEGKNLDILKYCVEKGCKIKDYTFLISLAAEAELINFIKYFVEAGMDVNFDSGLALKTAIKNDNLEIVKYLIEECDAETDSLNGTQITVCSMDMVRYLVSKKIKASFLLFQRIQ